MMLALALLPFSLLALFIYTLTRYIHDPKSLRRFPSPSLARFTPLWSMYHSWTGRQTSTISAAHKSLGPIIRIAPNHISFTDPVAYRDIYGHGASLRKDDFYSHIADGNPSVSQATEKSVHAGKRRALAHVFSAREVVRLEPRVIKCVEGLCAVVEGKARGVDVQSGEGNREDEYPVRVADGAFNIRPWLNMFGYDAISAMLFTSGYNFLSNGNDLCPSMDEQGNVTTVHAMESFHSASLFNTVLAQLPLPLYKAGRRVLFFMRGNKAGADFAGMARAMVQARLENRPTEPDLFSFFPIEPSEKRPQGMPVEEVIAECATMLDAGNDTTQATLTGAIYHLAKNPKKQVKLYEALSATLPEEYKGKPFIVLPTTILKEIPYLRAVLEENWRCRPPVARGLPRRTMGEGANIAGHFIPAGVTVSAPIYAIHRDESLFRNPEEFMPERWLATAEDSEADRKELQNLKNFCIPFSLGPRACIGRNLAYMEVSIVVAALVLNFEWELAEPGSVMETIERFNRGPKELFVKATPRSVQM
ncbi:cytochrome P450 [Aspergillus insuetus]